jgi:pimeloyl-ACP methyl ester carboxylesterase
VTLPELAAQLAAEQAFQQGEGLVPLLHTITNPLLVVTATNDMTNPPSDQVAIMENAPDAVLVTFDGCGHLALFQEVDAFAALVSAFTAAPSRFVPQPASAYKCDRGAM